MDEVRTARAERLPRRLGVLSAAAVLVGSTIGSGIFRVPSEVAAQVGTVGAIMMIWLLGAVVMLFGALTIAELAAMFPRSGGVFVFLREAYGPLPAFLFGWTELLLIRPSALGAIAMIFAEYLDRLVPLGERGVPLVAAAAIALLAAANIRSVTWGAAVQNVSTVATVSALVGLTIVLLALGDGSVGSFASPVEWSPLTWGGFGVAMVSVMWAYDGWADLTFIAGEVKDPGRTMPRALLSGAATIAVIYLCVNLAYLYVLSPTDLAASPLVAADAMTRIFGAIGASVIAALVMVSTFGALNGSTMTGPRILYALADDGLFFSPVAAVHKRFQTPYVAIGLAAALGIAYVSVRSFEQLASSFILGIWPFYALAVGAVFLLRRRRPDAERPYRTFGYPVVPIVFLLGALYMLGNALIEQPLSTMRDFSIILIGIPVYSAWRWYARRSA